jgi:hypothetical protein
MYNGCSESTCPLRIRYEPWSIECFENCIWKNDISWHSGSSTIRGVDFLCKGWFFLKPPRPENGGWWQNVVWYASFSTSFHCNRYINLETDAVFISFQAAWWQIFGYSTPALQKLAMWLVSQCASATGCERNWGTFAFIPTKVRNCLTYEKLHKLIYVNYNLRIQNSIDGGSPYHDEDDSFNRLMELTLVDASNPIHEWMERARSTIQPELDEESP